MPQDIRNRIVSLLAAGMICAPLTAGAQARPVVFSVDYSGIGFARLISIYKQAYADAGFTFGDETTEGGRYPGVLDFHITIPEFAGMPQGAARFSLIPRLDDDGICSPCSISRITLGVNSDDYGPGKAHITTARVAAADAKAVARIRLQLGKSLRSSEDPQVAEPLDDY
jgi:hypothetical protein